MIDAGDSNLGSLVPEPELLPLGHQPPLIQGLHLLDEVVARSDPLFLWEEPEPVSRVITLLVSL